MSKQVLIVSLSLIAAFSVACASMRKSSTTTAKTASQAGPSAGAELKPTRGNNVTGTVTFHEMGDQVHVVADISGLKPGKHGFHIHEKGDCSAPDATSAGAHFNPDSQPHGAPTAAAHHAGDFGNIEANASGNAHLETTVNFITVSDGPKSVVGRSVIVHAAPDDLTTQPTGNAGARLACGVIEKK
ncbi:MAG TPA: superoxide dismutase family protein [Acidobacteriota bacterium]|jgi:Cu-Zn family superoxide dismutase|nr:superoxide dismutase family protein [Acidobacteriota bacterium]